MANVWDAMKKHQAEQAAAGKPDAAPPAQPPPPKAPRPAKPVDEPAAKGAASDAPQAAQHAAPVRRPAQPQPAQQGKAAAQVLVPAPSAADSSWKKDPYARSLRPHYDRGGRIAEEYRALRTSLMAQSGGGFCYVVTSAEASEGKTITCLNLAMVLAEKPDHRTLVIDCDLRRGLMAELIGVDQTPGMAELLRGRSSIDEVIQSTRYENLSVIAAGHAKPEEVGELIARPQAEGFFGEVRRMFDYVLIDTPPINAVSDAGVIGRSTGEALIVVRMNKTRRESVDRAVALLRAANIKPAGLIMTHRKYYIPGCLYRYS